MKKLILAMTLFCALLTPCFSQKMTEKEISSLITSDFNLNEEKVVFAKRFFTILEEYENWCLLIQYENTSKKEFDIVIVSFDNKSYVKYC